MVVHGWQLNIPCCAHGWSMNAAHCASQEPDLPFLLGSGASLELGEFALGIIQWWNPEDALEAGMLGPKACIAHLSCTAGTWIIQVQQATDYSNLSNNQITLIGKNLQFRFCRNEVHRSAENGGSKQGPKKGHSGRMEMPSTAISDL